MLESILLVSILCVGLSQLTNEDSILEEWQKVAYNEDLELRSEFFNPLTECLACMSSFWTCIYLFFMNHTELANILLFIGTFSIILLIDMITKKKVFYILKYIYLTLVAFYLYQTDIKTLSLFILLGVYGMNLLFSKILAFIDNNDRVA